MAEVKYLKSKNIKIFPFGSDRAKFDPYGRLLNESNLVRLIKSFVDYDSYVITYDKETKQCVFVVGGYYCECNLTDVIVKDKPLYAYIYLISENTNPTFLDGNDDETNDTFTAIKFTYTEPVEPVKFSYFLQLLDTDENVPVNSYRKFYNTSVTNTYTLIDCGHAKGFKEN